MSSYISLHAMTRQRSPLNCILCAIGSPMRLRGLMGGHGAMDGQQDKCICDSSIVNRLEGLEGVNDGYIDLFLCGLHLDILLLYELVNGHVIDAFMNLWLNASKVDTII